MKVLIIDDDEAMIGIWSTVLKKDAIEVLTAGSGKLGIELAQKNVPDFILLDQIITDMKGNDVLKQLKSNPTTAQIPVALVSNYSEPEMMHEAIESGAIDYILKYQIDPSELAAKIKTLLHGTKPLNPADPSAQLSQQPAPTQPAAPQPQVVDPTTPQPQVIQPGQPTPGQPVTIDPSASSTSTSNVAQANVAAAGQVPTAQAPAAPAANAQPVVIDPTKPTQ